jgi:hypothetical protein
MLLVVITQSHEHRIIKFYCRQDNIVLMNKVKIEQMISSSRSVDLERNRKWITQISNYVESIT